MRNHIYRATYKPPAAVAMRPWTPAGIATALWLDAEDASTITVDVGVSEWRDKSGNGRHATMDTAGKQPTVAAASINGLDSLLFDDVDDGMRTACDISTSGNWSIAYCARYNSEGITTDVDNWDRAISSDTINAVMHATRDTYNVFLANAGSIRNAPAANGGDKGIGILVAPAGGTFEYWHNGINATDGSFAVRSWGIITLGACGYINDEPADANICEVMAYYDTGADTRQRIEGYLAHKWGLAASLPADHPYKDAPPMVPVGGLSDLAAIP